MIRYFADLLRTSFWFLPALMMVITTSLSFFVVEIDRELQDRVPESVGWMWTYTGGPEGARSILSVIASSMITVAGVVFSITIVALSLASTQFGPRLLRNFIRDRANQAVLGTFIATFIYCLLVIRTVRGEDNGGFVPGLSVALGVMFALASLGVLIYFIHHVAISIRADEVILGVTAELHETIDYLFPDPLPDELAEETPVELPADFDEHSAVVRTRLGGYVLAIRREELRALASERNVLVRLLCRPGHFLLSDNPVIRVWPAEGADDGLGDQLAGLLVIGQTRTAFQDLEFSIDQLVEVAVRALSPGMNDPFTAIRCVDRLSEVLCKLAQRDVPGPYWYDDDKRLRVIEYRMGFPEVLDAALRQIRQYGASSVAVAIRMLQGLEAIAQRARRHDDLRAIARHGALIHRAALASIDDESDREDVTQRYDALERVLAGKLPTGSDADSLRPAAARRPHERSPTVRTG